MGECATPAAQVGHVACAKQCNVAIEANRKDVRLTEGGERVSGKFEADTPHTKFGYEKSPLIVYQGVTVVVGSIRQETSKAFYHECNLGMRNQGGGRGGKMTEKAEPQALKFATPSKAAGNLIRISLVFRRPKRGRTNGTAGEKIRISAPV